MFDTELRSFVSKFHQLRKAGFDAHLNLHARGGRYWVGLCAQLGEAEQQPHRQQKPRLRSPAYRRRQERRQAARQAAEQISTSDVPAAEAETNEAEISTEEVVSQMVPEAAEATELPKWFSDILSTESKIHGNAKLVVSDQLLGILNPGSEIQKGEKFSHTQIVRGLWTYIREKGLGSGQDYFSPDAMLAKVFRLLHEPMEKVQFADMKYFFQHHVFFKSTSKNIYNGRDMSWYMARSEHYDISFDNVLS